MNIVNYSAPECEVITLNPANAILAGSIPPLTPESLDFREVF